MTRLACGSPAASRLARLLDRFQARLMTRLACGEAAVLRLESFDPFQARLAALLALAARRPRLGSHDCSTHFKLAS